MKQLDHQANKTKRLEMGRRRFLKTSVTAASAVWLADMLKASIVRSAEADDPDLEEVQLLFVQNARDVVLDKNQLTLIGINATTIFFADRPKRIAGHMTTKDFVLDWQEGTGKESFHTDPPNAALSVFGDEEVVDVVVTLKNPVLAGGALVYEIDTLEQDKPIPAGPASLFIDPIGMPVSPTSVAGVHRRHRRRRRHAVTH